jgi:hypothetical protein
MHFSACPLKLPGQALKCMSRNQALTWPSLSGLRMM